MRYQSLKSIFCRILKSDSKKGFSFLDIAFSVVVLTIMILSIIGAYNWVMQSVQKNKNKTHAMNFVQTKIEEVKNKIINLSWDQVSPASLSSTETITINNKNYTRVTNVVYVKEDGSGNLQDVGWFTVTDLIKIKVTVSYTEGNDTKTVTMENLVANRSRTVSTGAITGWVKDSTTGNYLNGTGGYPQAFITTDQNPNYNTVMGISATSYTISRVKDGVYTVRASAYGYQEATNTVTVNNASVETANFSLVRYNTVDITLNKITGAGAGNIVRVSCNDGVSIPTDYTATIIGEVIGTFSNVKRPISGTTTYTLSAYDATTFATGSVTITVYATGSPGYTPDPVNFSLSGALTKGYLTGTIKDDTGTVINSPVPYVEVTDGENPIPTAYAHPGTGVYPSSGTFAILPGTWTATAKHSNTPPKYKEESYTVTISASFTTNRDFTLYRVGSIRGIVVESGVGKRDITINATGLSGTVQGSAVTDASGNFTIDNLPVYDNPYTIAPVISGLYSSSPTSRSGINVSSGTYTDIPIGYGVSNPTFTVTSTIGYIAGYVYKSGTTVPINTGVLIQVSSGSLPSLTTSIGPGNPPSSTIYSTVTDSNGYYIIGVPAGATSTTYNIRAVYVTNTNSQSSVSTVDVSNTNTQSSPASKNFSF